MKMIPNLLPLKIKVKTDQHKNWRYGILLDVENEYITSKNNGDFRRGWMLAVKFDDNHTVDFVPFHMFNINNSINVKIIENPELMEAIDNFILNEKREGILFELSVDINTKNDNYESPIILNNDFSYIRNRTPETSGILLKMAHSSKWGGSISTSCGISCLYIGEKGKLDTMIANITWGQN